MRSAILIEDTMGINLHTLTFMLKEKGLDAIMTAKGIMVTGDVGEPEVEIILKEAQSDENKLRAIFTEAEALLEEIEEDIIQDTYVGLADDSWLPDAMENSSDWMFTGNSGVVRRLEALAKSTETNVERAQGELNLAKHELGLLRSNMDFLSRLLRGEVDQKIANSPELSEYINKEVDKALEEIRGQSYDEKMDFLLKNDALTLEQLKAVVG